MNLFSLFGTWAVICSITPTFIKQVTADVRFYGMVRANLRGG